MANRGDGFLASISRIAPADDDDLGESETPDQMAQILEAIARASGDPQRVVVPMQPAPVFVDAPDLAPLLEAISANRLDPIMMAKTIAAAIVAAMPPQPDLTEVLDGIVTELGRLGKKFNSVAAGGGGGSASEVGLRTGINRDPVSNSNPLPTSDRSSLVPEPHDEILASYPTTSTEVYTYRLTGVTVATVTVTYSDAVTKAILASVVRS